MGIDQLSSKPSWRQNRTTPHPERVTCGVFVDCFGVAVISSRSDLSREAGGRRQLAATHEPKHTIVHRAAGHTLSTPRSVWSTKMVP